MQEGLRVDVCELELVALPVDAALFVSVPEVLCVEVRDGVAERDDVNVGVTVGDTPRDTV